VGREEVSFHYFDESGTFVSLRNARFADDISLVASSFHEAEDMLADLMVTQTMRRDDACSVVIFGGVRGGLVISRSNSTSVRCAFGASVSNYYRSSVSVRFIFPPISTGHIAGDARRWFSGFL